MFLQAPMSAFMLRNNTSRAAAAGWAAEDKIFENTAVIDGFQLILLDNIYKVS